ncbi:hypothetical protein, conserved [Babesia ovata]|uniref:Extracellular matrix-binding ebh n=1 Tax=Babesia ovata TaxID=189622 RepID=A0A2H6KJP5_9APIC|nr:uncharacterized protein BOVATA_047050 [Babesia ovata]GBE63212.1 hypothetical protein, conserved [Babesia ovata]
MAFLHGVLSGVKDDKNVSHYVNNIEPKLNDVIDTLHKHVGRGREHFDAASREVYAWLHYYDEHIKNRTNYITSRLESLSTDLDGTHKKSVEQNIGQPLAKQLTTWNETVGNISTAVGNIHKEVDNLDPALKLKIRHEIEPIKTVVSHLKKVGATQEFVSQVAAVDTELDKQQKNLEKAINEQIDKVHTELENRTRKIISSIEALYAKGDEQFKAVRNAVQDAKTNVDRYYKGFETEFMAPILACFDDIKTQLMPVDPTSEGTGASHNNSKLKQQADLIKTKLLAVADQLGGYVYELGTWMSKNEKFIETAQKDAVKIIRKDAGWQNQIKLDAMSEEMKKLKGDLEKYITNDIKGELEKLVHQAETAFGTLKMNAVRKEPGGSGDPSVDYNWEKLTKKIKSLVEAINGEHTNKPDYEGLKGIQEKVKEWAENFKKEGDDDNGFKGIVRRWLEDLLYSEPVMASLGDYAANKKDAELEDIFDDAETGISGLAKAIVGKLTTEIGAAVVAAQENPGTTIQENIAAVQDACDTFADALVKRITNEDKNILQGTKYAFFGVIATAMDTAIKKSADAAVTRDKYKLTPTIDIILHQLVVVARRAGEAVESLTGDGGYNLGRSIEEAISHVGLIDEQFKEKTENLEAAHFGPKITKALVTVREQVETLTPILNTKNGSLKSKVKEINLDATTKNLDKWSNDLTHHLREITSAFARTGRNINAYLNGLNTEQINVQLRKIKNDIEKLKIEQITTDHCEIQTAIKSVIAIIGGLENVPADVKKKKGEVDDLLKQIKEYFRRLQLNIEYIGGKVDVAERALINAINEVDKVVRAAYGQIKHAVDTLKGNLLAAVQSAFAQVIVAVKKLYVTERLADLKALGTVVYRQIREVEWIIQNDKVTGVKGFLNTLNKHFAYPLNKFLTPPQPPKAPSGNQGQSHKKTFVDLAKKLHEYFAKFFTNLEGQTDFTPDFKIVAPSKEALAELLTGLAKSQHFDHEFSNHLDELENVITALKPSEFGDAESPSLLNALRQGFLPLVTQLDKAYVNKYSGEYWYTYESRKYAMVCSTIMSTLFRDLSYLKGKCNGSWRFKKIHAANDLGDFFDKRGFTVCKEENIQDGQLRNDEDQKGQELFSGVDRLFDVYGTGHLEKLHDALITYNCVCHITLPSNPKYPSSVRDMLSWICGLPFTQVYGQVKKHCAQLLKKEVDEAGKRSETPDPVITEILETNLCHNLSETCRLSYNTLTRIQGHGHGAKNADYPYACNFRDNSRGFHYPNDVGSLFDVLREICQRVLSQLTFLRGRCRAGSQIGGWADCSYGQMIPSYQWDCDKSSGEVTSKPECQAKCQPNCQPTCQPKSPLQAHLTDQLPGFMPHDVTSKGIKLSCSTCPKTSPGKPCITPMGFWDLPNSASKIGFGKEIYQTLHLLCQNAGSPLCALLRCLKCLCPVAPKNLDDMFSFFCHVMQGWYNSDYAYAVAYKGKIDEAIKKAFPLSLSLHENYQVVGITDALRDLYYSKDDHRGDEIENCHYDLWSVSKHVPRNDALTCSANTSITCAPYLQPLGLHANHTYSPKHSAIIDTIRELEGKIGKGSGVSGFCDAIGSVQQGLQGYEGKHTELTTNVLMDVNTIKSRITHLDSQFNDIRSKTLVNQLNDIKPVAADMSSTADLLWKDNDLLDDGLKKQLTPAVEKVKQAVGGFNSVAGDTGVTTQASLVDRAIEEKRQHLEGQINKGALELERKLDVEVKKIQSELTALKDETLKSEITLLRQALQDAKADIVDLLDNFDGTHKPQISEKFDQIKSALKDVLPDKKGKSPLDKQVDALKEKVGDTEGVYQHVLRNIKREVNSAVTSAAEHLTKVDEAVKRDLWTIRQNVEEQLNKYVKEYLRLVTEQLRIIKEKVGKDKNDNKDSIAKHWEVLTSRITTLVKMINGRDGETGKPYYKGLKGIKERVKVWREGFTDAKGFEKIVEKWIRSILKGNEDVKFWIKQYVDDNKRKNGDGCFNSGIIDTKHSQIGDEGIPKIAEVIKDKIIQKLNRGEFEQTLYLAGRSGNNIQDNLNAVRFVCEKFAKQVGEKLAKKANDIKDYKKHLDDLVSQIVTEIEGVCKNGGTATENEHLEYAIAITLVALQSASRHTAKALGNFTTAKDKSKRITYNISTNVDAAIAGVALIKDILGDEHGSTNEPGSKITKALKDLDSQIEKLHGDLRKSTTSSDPASDPKLIQIEDSVEKRVENILSDNVGTNGSEGQVKKNFGEDGFMAAYNDETKLNAADGKLRDRINKINEPINKYFEKTSSTNIDFDALSEYIKTLEEYNNAIRDVKATVSKLETVPSSIETMSEETLQLLQELRQNIKRLETQIDGIQENVNNAERNIEEAIVSLHESVNKSHIKIYDETENFRKSLLSAVKSSFDSVKNSVQSLFARQKQAELTQLQSVVTEQLEKIEEIIREDKSTGVKGFLTILREGCLKIS